MSFSGGALAVESYADQLERVQTAIAAIETRGQASGISGRNLTKADLKTLYEREAWLRRMVAREARGGIRVRYAVPRDC